MVDERISGQDLEPADVTEWLRIHRWTKTAALGDIAQLWKKSATDVVVPMLPSSPDFSLRWSEMLRRLADSLGTDPEGVLLAVTRAGSDIAEFRASGQIDDSIPLGDASTLVDSIRRAMQASANSALQPRSYYGHSLPDAARDYARNVRLGQTRRGSYVVPVISRLPILRLEDDDEDVLFEEAGYQPFARSAMLKLAQGLTTLRDLTHGPAEPAGNRIVEAVAAGVSSELCEAVASTLDTSSIADLDVNFAWSERVPNSTAPQSVKLESGAVPLIRHVGSFLRGEALVGRQTIIGYVKRLDRGEDDTVGRVTLRVLDNDKARNISMDLDDSNYHIAGVANAERRMVAATGLLHREPGRTLRLDRVDDFHLLESLPGVDVTAGRPLK